MPAAPTNSPEPSPRAAGAATLILLLLPGCGSSAAVPDPLELPPGMDLVLRSPRLEIHTDYPSAQAAFQQQVLEGLCAWFEEHWFPVPRTQPLRVLLFDDPERMRAWDRARGLEDSMGRYVREWNLITVDTHTGIGTAYHELVHSFLQAACAHPRTVFVEEGVASFFEKFLGYVDAQGRVQLTLGYFSPWRFAHAKAVHHSFDIAQHWNVDHDHFDYAIARSFMLFLHRNGWFLPFVRALRTATGDGRAELEAIASRPLAQLDQQWHAWIDAQEYVLGGDVFLVEKSFVLPLAEWQQWLTDNEKRLRFDEALGIWRVR